MIAAIIETNLVAEFAIFMLLLAAMIVVVTTMLVDTTLSTTKSNKPIHYPPFKIKDSPMYKSTTITYMKAPNEKTKPTKKIHKSTNKAITRTK